MVGTTISMTSPSLKWTWKSAEAGSSRPSNLDSDIFPDVLSKCTIPTVTRRGQRTLLVDGQVNIDLGHEFEEQSLSKRALMLNLPVLRASDNSR